LTDWFEDAGLGGPGLGGAGVDVVTARLEIDFKASAGLGETLQTEIGIERAGNTSLTLSFDTRRLSDGEVVATGREVIVFVDPLELKPTPPPEEARARLLGQTG
jgi:acyl-CoA thioesterase FadM